MGVTFARDYVVPYVYPLGFAVWHCDDWGRWWPTIFGDKRFASLAEAQAWILASSRSRPEVTQTGTGSDEW